MVQESVRLGFSNLEDDLSGYFDVEPVLIKERSGIQGLFMDCIWVGDGLSGNFRSRSRRHPAPRNWSVVIWKISFRWQTSHQKSMTLAMYASVDGDLRKV